MIFLACRLCKLRFFPTKLSKKANFDLRRQDAILLKNRNTAPKRRRCRHIRCKISDLHLPRPLQELDEQAADDGAVLEVDVIGTDGVVPVGHGDAVAGEVVGGPQRGDVALKVGVALQEGGGPDQPVRLGRGGGPADFREPLSRPRSQRSLYQKLRETAV